MVSESINAALSEELFSVYPSCTLFIHAVLSKMLPSLYTHNNCDFARDNDIPEVAWTELVFFGVFFVTGGRTPFFSVSGTTKT